MWQRRRADDVLCAVAEVQPDEASATAAHLRTDKNEAKYCAKIFPGATCFQYNYLEDNIAHLGMFSKLKYVNSNNDQKIRGGFFQYAYRRGFIFPIKCFHGSKGNFPVGFLVC